MCEFDEFGDSLIVTVYGGSEQFIAFSYGFCHFTPTAGTKCSLIRLFDFIIRYIGTSFFIVISKISKMD